MNSLEKVLAGALLLAGAGVANAGAEENNLSVYRPAQGLSHRFGSKIAVGYFLTKEGTCAVNLLLAENVKDGTAPLASRVQVKVAPGEKLKLDTAQGEALEVKCGAGARTLEIKGAAASQGLWR